MRGLAGGSAAVTQVPGGEDERAAAGNGGEGGDRREQRGGHGDQPDPDDRHRDAVENPNCLAHTAYSGVARLALSSIAENAAVTRASATPDPRP
jgi:hypothetical protein